MERNIENEHHFSLTWKNSAPDFSEPDQTFEGFEDTSNYLKIDSLSWKCVPLLIATFMEWHYVGIVNSSFSCFLIERTFATVLFRWDTHVTELVFRLTSRNRGKFVRLVTSCASRKNWWGVTSREPLIFWTPKSERVVTRMFEIPVKFPTGV